MWWSFGVLAQSSKLLILPKIILIFFFFPPVLISRGLQPHFCLLLVLDFFFSWFLVQLVSSLIVLGRLLLSKLTRLRRITWPFFSPSSYSLSEWAHKRCTRLFSHLTHVERKRCRQEGGCTVAEINYNRRISFCLNVQMSWCACVFVCLRNKVKHYYD